MKRSNSATWPTTVNVWPTNRAAWRSNAPGNFASRSTRRTSSGRTWLGDGGGAMGDRRVGAISAADGRSRFARFRVALLVVALPPAAAGVARPYGRRVLLRLRSRRTDPGQRGQDGTVRMWELPQGVQRYCLSGPRGEITAVAFSPDGQWLASACGQGTVLVSEAATGKEVVTLRASEGEAYSVAFSPDGHWLATSGIETVVKLWNTSTWSVERTLAGHEAPSPRSGLLTRRQDVGHG